MNNIKDKTALIDSWEERVSFGGSDQHRTKVTIVIKRKHIITIAVIVLAISYTGYYFYPHDKWTFVTGINGAEISRYSLSSLKACEKNADSFFKNKRERLYECRKNCKKNFIHECEQILVCNLPNGCALKNSKEANDFKEFVRYENEIKLNRVQKENEQWQYIQDEDSNVKIANEKKIGGRYSDYSTDGRVVYYVKDQSLESPQKGKVIIKEADPQTFQVVQDNWMKDKRNVYRQGLIIKQLDPATFSILNRGEHGGRFIKDKFAVYRENIQPDFDRWILKLENADPKSFIALSDFHGKDKSSVYYSSVIIKGADPNTFEVLYSIYGKDKNHVYAGAEIKEGADPKTFKP